MESSYAKHNYGDMLYSLVRIHKPEACVELGCLQGYSSVHIAKGLKKNNSGHLTVIDLFEEYPYRSYPKEVVLQNWALHEVIEYCSPIHGDGCKEADQFLDGSVEFLHIDISNCADVLESVFLRWTPKLKYGAIVVFEGGSTERDQVPWMINYNKAPISQFLKSKFFTREFDYLVLQPFPSMTICQRK